MNFVIVSSWNGSPVFGLQYLNGRVSKNSKVIRVGKSRRVVRSVSDLYGPPTDDDDSHLEATALPSDPSEADDLKQQLLLSASGTNRGLAADSEMKEKILDLLKRIESTNPTPSPTSTDSRAMLLGQWKLVYTTALDVLSLGLLPLVQVGEVYQNIEADESGEISVFNVVELGSCLNPVASTIGMVSMNSPLLTVPSHPFSTSLVLQERTRKPPSPSKPARPSVPLPVSTSLSPVPHSPRRLFSAQTSPRTCAHFNFPFQARWATSKPPTSTNNFESPERPGPRKRMPSHFGEYRRHHFCVEQKPEAT